MPATRSLRSVDWAAVFAAAHDAGLAAAESCAPAPVRVAERAPMVVGGRLVDGPVTRDYGTVSGLSGGAVIILPVRYQAARWALAHLHAYRSLVSPGVRIPAPAALSTYEEAAAYADAYARVLRGHGIPAHVHSYLS